MGTFNSKPDIRKLFEKKNTNGLIKILKNKKQPFNQGLAAEKLGDLGDDKAIPALLEALDAQETDLKRAAVIALGKLKAKEAIEPLLATLKNPDFYLLMHVFHALGKIGDVSVVDTLLAYLENPKYAELTRYILSALGDLRDRRAVDPLIAFAEDNNKEVRTSAVEALGKIADYKALNVLIDALKDKESSVRLHAVKALSSFNDDSIREPLAGCLGDSELDVRKNAAAILCKAGDVRGVVPLVKRMYGVDQSVVDMCMSIGSPALQHVLEIFKNDTADYWKSASYIADAFGWEPDESEVGAAYWIGKENWNQCVSLGEIAIVPLIKKLATIESDNKAIGALIQIGEASVEPIIQHELLSNSDDTTGSTRSLLNAYKVLIALGEKSIQPLVKMLDSNNQLTTKRAIYVLGEIGSQRAIESVCKYLLSDDKQIRMGAANTLNKMNWNPSRDEYGASYYIELGKWDEVVEIGSAAVPMLLDSLNYNLPAYDEVRALGKIRDTQAIKHLGKKLRSISNANYESTIVQALQSIGGHEAIAELITSSACSDDALKALKTSLKSMEINEINEFISIYEDKDVVIWHDIIELCNDIGINVEYNQESIASLIYKKKWDACKLLGDKAVEPLINALEASDVSVSTGAAAVLGDIGGQEAVPALIKAVERILSTPGSYYHTSAKAAEALGKIGGEMAVTALVNALKNYRSHDVQTNAAKALININDIKSLKLIREVLKIKYPNSYIASQAQHGIIETKVALKKISKSMLRSKQLEKLMNYDVIAMDETDARRLIQGHWTCKINKDIVELEIVDGRYQWDIPKVTDDIQAGWQGKYKLIDANTIMCSSEIGGDKTYIIHWIDDDKQVWTSKDQSIYMIKAY